MELCNYQEAKAEGDKNQSFKKLLDIKARNSSSKLDSKYLKFFSKWYHGAILMLLKTRDASTDTKWIQKKLRRKLSEKIIAESVELLKELNLLIYDYEKDDYTPSDKHIRTGDEIRGHIFQSYHSQVIKEALFSLSEDEPGQRDISCVSMNIPKSAMKDVKKLSAEFRQKSF